VNLFDCYGITTDRVVRCLTKSIPVVDRQPKFSLIISPRYPNQHLELEDAGELPLVFSTSPNHLHALTYVSDVSVFLTSLFSVFSKTSPTPLHCTSISCRSGYTCTWTRTPWSSLWPSQSAEEPRQRTAEVFGSLSVLNWPHVDALQVLACFVLLRNGSLQWMYRPELWVQEKVTFPLVHGSFATYAGLSILHMLA
jgi:hypothetical protein